MKGSAVMKNMYIVFISEYQVSQARDEYWFEKAPVGAFESLEDARAFIAANMEEAKEKSRGPWMTIRQVPVNPLKVKSWNVSDYKGFFEDIKREEV